MLYLVQPTRHLLWCDIPARVLDHLADGVDLAKLQWQDTETMTTATTDSVRIALRYGVPVAGGIALKVEHIVEQNRVAEIASSTSAAVDSNERLRTSQQELMEKLIPGWTEHGEQLDRRIAESALESIDETLEEIQETIAERDPDPLLVEHWRALGGVVPDPV